MHAYARTLRHSPLSPCTLEADFVALAVTAGHSCKFCRALYMGTVQFRCALSSKRGGMLRNCKKRQHSYSREGQEVGNSHLDIGKRMS
jgi:hypothetical protein